MRSLPRLAVGSGGTERHRHAGQSCDVAFVTAAGQHSRARPRAASVRGMLGLAPSLSGPPDALLRVVAVRRRAAVAKHSSQQRHVPALDGVGRIRRGNGFLLGHGLTGVLGASRLRGSLLVAACSRTVTRRENPLSLPRYSGRPIRNNVDAGKGVVWLRDWRVPAAQRRVSSSRFIN